MNPQNMFIEPMYRYEYLRRVFDSILEDWQNNPTTENTLDLGWSIIECEGGLRNVENVDEPVYPSGYFRHLLTMDGQTLCALPAEIVDMAMRLDPSMARHYGLTRPKPVALFKETVVGAGTKIVAYFGDDL